MENLEKTVRLKGKKFLLQVETSGEARDYQRYEDLRNEIWGFPEDNLPGSRNLMCENFWHDGGALFIAVYAEGRAGEAIDRPGSMAAFSYGFVGVKDKEVAFKRTENLRFYSQYTGIKEEFRGYGLAVAIKEFQRAKVRDLFGIFAITCTYDPLTGVNAWRNVHYFGMEVEEYRVSTYGEYGGLLNRLDVPSDRFFMSWDLRLPARVGVSPWAAALTSRLCVVESRTETVEGRTGPADLEIISGLDLAKNDEILYVRIPRDFYLILQETDVPQPSVREIPLRWRRETRRLFLNLFERGYRVADFFATSGTSPENYYVLRQTETNT
jgi:predicted GNAT superfamily acetyltransferase